MDIVHRRGRLFPARSGTLWGAPGIPLHCCHAEGSRHLPVGVARGRVKALSPHRQSRILSRVLPGLRLGWCSPRGVNPAGALIQIFTDCRRSSAGLGAVFPLGKVLSHANFIFIMSQLGRHGSIYSIYFTGEQTEARGCSLSCRGHAGGAV